MDLRQSWNRTASGPKVAAKAKSTEFTEFRPRATVPPVYQTRRIRQHSLNSPYKLPPTNPGSLVSRVELLPTTHGLKAGSGDFAPVARASISVAAVGVSESADPRHYPPARGSARGFAGKVPEKGSGLALIEGGRDHLLSVRQVAARLGLCTRTVYELCERGELPHVRISNAIRVVPADLAAFVAVRSLGR